MNEVCYGCKDPAQPPVGMMDFYETHAVNSPVVRKPVCASCLRRYQRAVDCVNTFQELTSA